MVQTGVTKEGFFVEGMCKRRPAGLRMSVFPRENGDFGHRPAGPEEGPGLASPGDGNAITIG